MDTDIQKFIDTFSKEHNVSVIAAVLFGSSLYKSETEIFDIDLLLVLAEDSIFRGNYYCSKDRRIDYFSGSVLTLQSHLKQSIGTTDTILLNILGKGKILFGEDKISDLVTQAKSYLATFDEYSNKETLLKILWYKLTDAHDDFSKETDPMVQNLLLAQIISLSMEFFCVYHGELIEKKGTSTRGQFYQLHSALLTESRVDSINALMNYLSEETSYKIDDNWEIRYK